MNRFSLLFGGLMVPAGVATAHGYPLSSLLIPDIKRPAYDTLTLGVLSDAGQAKDFIQSYTVVVKLADD